LRYYSKFKLIALKKDLNIPFSKMEAVVNRTINPIIGIEIS